MAAEATAGVPTAHRDEVGIGCCCDSSRLGMLVSLNGGRLRLRAVRLVFRYDDCVVVRWFAPWSSLSFGCVVRWRRCPCGAGGAQAKRCRWVLVWCSWLGVGLEGGWALGGLRRVGRGCWMRWWGAGVWCGVGGCVVGCVGGVLAWWASGAHRAAGVVCQVERAACLIRQAWACVVLMVGVAASAMELAVVGRGGVGAGGEACGDAGVWSGWAGLWAGGLPGCCRRPRDPIRQRPPRLGSQRPLV